MKDSDTTTIRVTFGTKKKLSSYGKHGDSFDEIIQRMLKRK